MRSVFARSAFWPPRTTAPMRMFSQTVSSVKSPRPSGTWAIPSRATLSGLRPVIDRPANVIWPAVLTMPHTARSVVVFPAPFAPRRATTSPSSTVRETPCSAVIGPYRALTSRSSSSGTLLPEVGLDHLRVGAHLGGRALGDLPSEIENVDAVADRHDERHVVLHQEDRQLEVLLQAPERALQLLDLFVVEAAGRLVQEQQARPRDERARQLDALQSPEGKPRGRTIGEPGQAEVLERLQRLRAGSALAERPHACVRADEDVLGHRHRRKEDDVLERARHVLPDDPVRRRAEQVLTGEDDATRIGLVEPRDHVEERRLAGAVRADQPRDRFFLGRERHPVERNDPPEAARDVVDREQSHGSMIISGLNRRMHELEGGIRRVTFGLPLGIDHVHCYLLPRRDGSWIAVDTGLGLPDAGARWRAVLDALEGPVARILITHFHPDHVGASAELAALTGAPVSQGREDYDQCVRAWGEVRRPERFPDDMRANGVPEEEIDVFRGQAGTLRQLVRFVRDPERLSPGDEVDGWRVLHLPGHADGHLAFLRDGILIVGDALLLSITPNVGLYPDSRPDPLGDYLASLEQIAELAPRVALAGHREVIDDPAGRARELIAHHGERLKRTADALDGRPQSAYAVSFSLFPEPLSPTLRRFALAETRAHLEYLVRRDAARRLDEDRRVSYLASR